MDCCKENCEKCCGLYWDMTERDEVGNIVREFKQCGHIAIYEKLCEISYHIRKTRMDSHNKAVDVLTTLDQMTRKQMQIR